MGSKDVPRKKAKLSITKTGNVTHYGLTGGETPRQSARDKQASLIRAARRDKQASLISAARSVMDSRLSDFDVQNFDDMREMSKSLIKNLNSGKKRNK